MGKGSIHCMRCQNSRGIETAWFSSNFVVIQVSKNCSCNNCESSCDDSSGFVYTEPRVFEDFNYPLVLSTWGISIAIVVALTIFRKKNSKK